MTHHHPSEIEIMARKIMATEVYFSACALVEYLIDQEDLDCFNHMANKLYCPICDCVSSHCANADDAHDFEQNKVEEWFLIDKKLANNLEKLNEIVLWLDDLDIYFWGRCDRISGNNLDNNIFNEIAVMRLKEKENE
jgi:hypothetical protein